jgi:accessory gene regulator protein AgrB
MTRSFVHQEMMCFLQVVVIFVRKALCKVDISSNTTAHSQLTVFLNLKIVGMGPQEKERYWHIREYALVKSLSDMKSARMESQKGGMTLGIEGHTLVKNVSNVISVGKCTLTIITLLHIKEHTQEKGLSYVICVGKDFLRKES